LPHLPYNYFDMAEFAYSEERDLPHYEELTDLVLQCDGLLVPPYIVHGRFDYRSGQTGLLDGLPTVDDVRQTAQEKFGFMPDDADIIPKLQAEAASYAALAKTYAVSLSDHLPGGRAAASGDTITGQTVVADWFYRPIQVGDDYAIVSRTSAALDRTYCEYAISVPDAPFINLTRMLTIDGELRGCVFLSEAMADGFDDQCMDLFGHDVDNPAIQLLLGSYIDEADLTTKVTDLIKHYAPIWGVEKTLEIFSTLADRGRLAHDALLTKRHFGASTPTLDDIGRFRSALAKAG